MGSTLTSVRHPDVAAARRLKKRAFRDQDGRFLVEGPQGVAEAITAGALHVLFAVDDLDPLVVHARQRGLDVHAVTNEVMSRLTSTVTPQGLVGVAGFVDVPLAEVPVGGCTVLLHDVRDPGNAGMVVRSADAAGASCVVFTGSSVDVYNAKTVRASAGSLFHAPVVRSAGIAEAISMLGSRGVRVLAMDANGNEDLYRTDLSAPVAFVLGNEAHGLPDEVRELAGATVKVPHVGPAESLNLAAAATVCVFEWARRRRIKGEALESIIAAAAHDIRSPLTAMKGFGYALETRWKDMSDDQRSLMLGGIVYDADRMDTILRQLVDAARVVGGRLETFPERCDIGELVRQIAETQSRDPEHPPIEWLGGDVVGFVDPGRLKTSIMSFVESAVWWAKRGPVGVAAMAEEGHLRVDVSRAETELSSEGAENLFLPRRPGSGGGSKIGLYVARLVAEAQGGRAWADVADGTLVFHLHLPTG